jgi:hypothetical protein
MLQKLNKKSSIVGGVVRLLLSIAPSSPLNPLGQKSGGFSFTEKYHVRQKTNEAHEETHEAR